MYKQINANKFLLPKQKNMNMLTEGLVFANDAMLPRILEDGTLKQVINVACLQGIVGKSLAMPDCHQGYGFCIGGVAAFDLDEGIMSCGGVGFDINCGVRLLASNLKYLDIKDRIKDLINQLFRDIPTGTGGKQTKALSNKELDAVLNTGVKYALDKGYAFDIDMEHCESSGCIKDADSDDVSERAKDRGKTQLGTLGSGNHFLEIQNVEQIFDKEKAELFGLEEGQIVVLIHTGSRGLGHQVCTEYLKLFQKTTDKYGIRVPDRQLASAPINSKEGKAYFRAMNASANFAFTNRQIITHLTRYAFNRIFGSETNLRLVYDIAHNIAKIEEHTINGKKKNVLVYRKGATRAFPKGHIDIPNRYKSVGQPVLIPGSMGTSSYVLFGNELAMNETFGSICHGAGREMSRSEAKRKSNFEEIRKMLNNAGVIFQTNSKGGLVEEAPFAYKDIDSVIGVVKSAGLANIVAKMKPLGVIKG